MTTQSATFSSEAEPEWFARPQRLSELLAVLDHEVRTPLGPLLGFAGLIKEADGHSTEKKDYAEIILKNAQILSESVKDILELAKLETGISKMQVGPLSLKSLVIESIGLLQFEAAKRKVEFVLFPVGLNFPKVIQSDTTKVHRIICGLMDVALRHSRKSSVSIKLENEDSSVIVQIEHEGTPAETPNFKLVYFKLLALNLGGSLHIFEKNNSVSYRLTINPAQE